VLRQYCEERGLGRITVNKVAYRLTPTTGPEPDVAFVRSDRLHILRPGYVDGPPDVAIEIISPDSVYRDYEQKRHAYEAAAVKEYWIIDPEEKRATFLTRGAAGFREQVMSSGMYRSEAIDGFYFDVSRLWQKPLPSTMAMVHALLMKDR
jgi:Uma2 family endonuclease